MNKLKLNRRTAIGAAVAASILGLGAYFSLGFFKSPGALEGESVAAAEGEQTPPEVTEESGDATPASQRRSATTPSFRTSSGDKASKLGGFKFGGFNKTGDDSSEEANSAPPAPNLGSSYSLNDEEDDGSDGAPPAAPTYGYGDDDAGYGAGTTGRSLADDPQADGDAYGESNDAETYAGTGYGDAAPGEAANSGGIPSSPFADGYGIAGSSSGGSLSDEPQQDDDEESDAYDAQAELAGVTGSDGRLSPLPNRTSSLPPNPLPAGRLASTPLGSSPLGSTPAPAPAATAPRYSQELGGLSRDLGSLAPPPGIPQTSNVEPQTEGLQTPTIAVEKFAPPEVQVGKTALFEIVVKNVGKVPAYDVTVVDEIPQGTRFQQASPEPTESRSGSLVWKLGAMRPGEEQIIELHLVPVAEGEIGSVAQVSFQAQAGARSVVTRPRLEVRHQAPPQVHAGTNATVLLSISNGGTGAATNVLLQSDVPPGFSHPAGQELEFEVGTLRPGETKQVELVLKAEHAGQYENVFVIRGDGDLVVQESAVIEVVAPSLQVGVTGPKKRFVERQATHAISIANPGTAAAREVDLIAYLPRGFKFISADHQGQYDSRQHAVVWGLEELPPGASGSVQLTTLPVEAGEQKLRVEGRSTSGLTAEFEQIVTVDAISELSFTVADLADPIEIGSETQYEIRIFNRGAKDATNVVVAVGFPAGMSPLGGEAVGTRATVVGQKVEFAPLARLAPGSEAVLRVRAQGIRPGDHRVAVSLASDEQQSPITKEESTRVYADQ
jgi:uncharacterized repeat protein (TIGR01451 family)